jgi:Zn-dependent M16 (insulinase) family peptidase
MDQKTMRHYLLSLLLASVAMAENSISYSDLKEGQTLDGFRATAVYLDDSGHAIGARFHHERTNFTLDLLQIQSAPQAFIWVTTFPTSNMGEPHTQEHLLLGKGNKGRDLGSQETMSLATSTAFTMQWRTCYSFYTSAGPNAFFQHFDRTMDALLYPDYSGEEIRREVRNFGIDEDSKDGSLHLEEKGTVYNEMVTSMDQANWRLYHAALLSIYGPGHPLSYVSGGLPADLRVIQPSDIRRFHDQHYFLANMGAIVSLPKEVSLGAALERLDAVLKQLQESSKSNSQRAVMTEAQLAAPKAAPAGRIEYVEYPLQNDQQPGSVYLAWPADRKLTLRDKFLLELFMDNVAGEADTNLYKRLIDSKTREADIGAKGVDGYVDDGQGNFVMVTFRDMPVSKMNDADLSALRGRVMDEFQKIVAYPDGSPELTQFQKRLKSRIAEQRRALAKLVNSPPGFGFRGGNTAWLDRLYELNKEPGFRKIVTSKDDLAAIEKLISGSHNIWHDHLKQWKILGAVPYIEAAKPNPALVREASEERAARVAAQTARLRQGYGASSDQQALERYRADYDEATKVLEEAEKSAAGAKFVEHPPMGLDDGLEFKASKLARGVPLVASTFASMTSATTGIALRLDGVPEDRLVYVSLLPGLLMNSGVIENGKAVSYEEMSQRLRNEILSLDSGFSINTTTDRDELAMRGAGNNAAEAKRAIEWMELALYHPYWRTENLPRLRDYVDQALGGLRRTMQNAEEYWVSNPETAYRKQENPLMLSSSSFLTRVHNVQRLRWMLKDGGSDAVYGFLRELGEVKGSRVERKAILAAILDGKYAGPTKVLEMEKLSDKERGLEMEAARDLEASLNDIPDASLAVDWRYLCGEMARDLRQGPERTLAILDEVRRSILVTGGARVFVIGSSATQAQLSPGIERLSTGLQSGPFKKVAYSPGRRIDARLLSREPGVEKSAAAPLFVGLLNANSQGGVFENSAPLTSYHDTSRDALLDYLAVNLYGGHGAHGLFMKTWAAGLAYSNGISASLNTGRVRYYAERTPELPQTLKFVIGVLKSAQPDASLADYAIAGAFQASRAADSYEARGESMAADLADGLTPEVVKRFHQAILDLKRSPDLAAELFLRISVVDAKVLPGMGTKAKDVEGAVYFVIGPEKQLSAWEDYLKHEDSAEARVWRLYPRDFWFTGE